MTVGSGVHGPSAHPIPTSTSVTKRWNEHSIIFKRKNLPNTYHYRTGVLVLVSANSQVKRPKEIPVFRLISRSLYHDK
jgi:hypothetical protein